MSPEQMEKYIEIRRLLREAYDDYFARTDGHYKSSEGYIEVRYPTYFRERDGADPLVACGLGIYSYCLGPHRMHDFEDFDEALAEVRKWHKERLAEETE